MSEPVQNAPQETANDAGGEPPKSEPVQFNEQQQAVIDKLIGERLKRAKEQWSAELDENQRKEAEANELKRLEEEKQYQQLIDKQKTQLAEAVAHQQRADHLAGQLQQYQTVIESLLNTQLDEFGDIAKNAVAKLPGEPDALAKLEWLNDNAALFKSAAPPTTGGTPARRGIPPRPPQPAAAPENYQPIIRF